MATGDDAVAAGMDIIDPSTGLVKDGATEINKTRDYIAQKTSAVLPIDKGGTASTTAAGARTALGITPGNIGAAAASHNHDASAITSGTLDPGRINNALEMLGTQNGFGAPNGVKAVFARNDGQFYTNGIRASGGASGWNNVGVNADGRLVDTNSSTRRLKENIEPFDPAVDGDFDALQVVSFDWKDGTGNAIGVIAEDVEAAGYGWLVTRDLDGRVSGVQYDRLVLIVISEVQRLRAEVSEIKERLTDLEQQN